MKFILLALMASAKTWVMPPSTINLITDWQHTDIKYNGEQMGCFKQTTGYQIKFACAPVNAPPAKVPPVSGYFRTELKYNGKKMSCVKQVQGYQFELICVPILMAPPKEPPIDIIIEKKVKR